MGEGENSVDTSFVKEVLASGGDAPRVVVRRYVSSEAETIAATARAHRGDAEFDVEDHVKRLRKSAARLARAQGAGAGLATTLAELGGSAAAGPPGALTATVLATGTDLVILSRIQIRQTLSIAAAYGHDLNDAEARVHEILALHNLETTGTKGASAASQRTAQTAAKRLIERHLRGQALQAVKALFRFVGIRFTRNVAIKYVPLVNVPVNAAVAEGTTRHLGGKAQRFYRDLPAPPMPNAST